MPEKQQRIDFGDARGQQQRQSRRGLIRSHVSQVPIPRPPGGERRDLPSQRVCRLVLVLLDELIALGEASCLTMSEIAAECDCSRRTVVRALAWLEAVHFVESVRSNRAKVYSLNRTAIAEHLKAAPEATSEDSTPKGVRRRCDVDVPEMCRRCDVDVPDRHISGTSDAVENDDPSLLIENYSSSSSQIGGVAEEAPREEEEDSNWGGVKRRLRGCGVKAINSAVAGAVAAGLTPGRVDQLIDEFHGRPEQNAGGLFWCLTEGGGVFPDLREDAERDRRDDLAEQRRRSAQRAELDSQRREKQAAADRSARLESAFGPQLDAMAGDELEELVHREYTPEALRLLRYFDRRGSPHERLTPTMRGDLLAALHRDASHPSTPTEKPDP